MSNPHQSIVFPDLKLLITTNLRYQEQVKDRSGDIEFYGQEIKIVIMARSMEVMTLKSGKLGVKVETTENERIDYTADYPYLHVYNLGLGF